MNLPFIEASGLSHRGTVRSKNDDHYCLASWTEQEALCSLSWPVNGATFQDYGLLCAVADGMGGYEGGELAARVVLETFATFFYAQKRTGANAEQIKEHLIAAHAQAQRALNATLRRDEQLAKAGTTLAGVVLMPPDIAVTFHIGDSRILRYSGGYLRVLSTDHTPLASDLLSGRLSEVEAAAMPQASQLTRALGMGSSDTLEFGETLHWEESDCFLLTTDGLHGLGRGLSLRAVRDLLSENGTKRIEDAVQITVEAAVAADGGDNATLVLLRCRKVQPDQTGNTNPFSPALPSSFEAETLQSL